MTQKVTKRLTGIQDWNKRFYIPQNQIKVFGEKKKRI